MINDIPPTCDSKSFQMPNQGGSKQLTKETRGVTPSWPDPLGPSVPRQPLAPLSFLTPARRLWGRGNAPRTPEATWPRAAGPRPSRHGGGARRTGVSACCPVLLHSGSRLRALPDAGGAGAAGGHGGEWASLRVPEGRRGVLPLLLSPPGGLRAGKALRPPRSPPQAGRGDVPAFGVLLAGPLITSGKNRLPFFPCTSITAQQTLLKSFRKEGEGWGTLIPRFFKRKRS